MDGRQADEGCGDDEYLQVRGNTTKFGTLEPSRRALIHDHPTPAFWGELASMAPRLRGFDITLYAMQRDDIPAMRERFIENL